MKAILYVIPVVAVLLFASCQTCIECSLTSYCFTATGSSGGPQQFCYNTLDEAQSSRTTLQSFGASVSTISSNVQDSEEFCADNGDVTEGYRIAKESDGYECR